MTTVQDFGVTFLDSITDRILFAQIEASENVSSILTSHTAQFTSDAAALADLNSELDAQTALLTTISNIDHTTELNNIDAELEAQTSLITSANALLTTIASHDDSAALADLNSELDAQTTLLTTIASHDDSAALADLNSELDAQTTLLTSISAGIGGATDYRYEVSLGHIPNAKTVNVFGSNIDVDTSSPEVMANFGGLFSPLKTASVLTIVSSSANDTAAGTGSRVLRLVGVDANRDFQQEDVTLNGTTDVVTTSTWLGVNHAEVISSGSNDTNDGDISIQASDLSMQAFVSSGEGLSQQMIYYTEAGHRALIDYIILNVDKNTGGGEPKCTFRMWTYSEDTNSKRLIGRYLLDARATTTFEIKPSQPYVINENSVVWLEAETNVNNTEVHARMSFIDSSV